MAASPKKNPVHRAGSWRTCAGCGRRLPRRELLRLVRGPEGDCLPDPFRQRLGRGLNLCWDPRCWQKAEQRGVASRRLGARLHAVTLSRQLACRLAEEFRRYWQIGHQGSFVLLEPAQVEQAAAAGRAALVLILDPEAAGGTAFVPFRRVPRSLREACPEAASVTRAAITHRGLARRLRQLLDRVYGLNDHQEVTSQPGTDDKSSLAVDMAAGDVDHATVLDRRKV